MGNNKQKAVLVVNSFASNQYLSDKLKEAGIYSIGLYTFDLSKLSDYFKPHKELFSEHLYLANASVDAIIEALSGYTIEYVINGCDEEWSTNLTDSLAQILIPQYANDPATTDYRSDKIQMHQQLFQHNLAHIEQIIVTKDNYHGFLDAFIYPAFIKPLNGDGSVGAMSITSAKDLEKYFKENNLILNTGSIISEYILAEKIVGEEYLIDTFSIDGEHYIATIQKYEKEVINGFPKCVNCIVESDNEKCEKISNYVKNVLTATGFKNGFAHVECFYTSDNKVVLVEINPRISGAKGLCHDLANYCGQQNQIEIFLDKIFMIPLPKHLINPAKVVFLYNGGENLMPDLTAIDLVKYGVVEVRQFVSAGTYSNANVEKVRDAAAVVIVVSENEQELNHNIAKIKKMDDLAWKGVV